MWLSIHTRNIVYLNLDWLHKCCCYIARTLQISREKKHVTISAYFTSAPFILYDADVDTTPWPYTTSHRRGSLWLNFPFCQPYYWFRRVVVEIRCWITSLEPQNCLLNAKPNSTAVHMPRQVILWTKRTTYMTKIFALFSSYFHHFVPVCSDCDRNRYKWRWRVKWHYKVWNRNIVTRIMGWK